MIIFISKKIEMLLKKYNSCKFKPVFKKTIMSSQINFNTIPANVPGICVPRAFSNITEKRVKTIFEELGLGEIDRIVIAPNKANKEKKTNHIFVYLKAWNKTGVANEVRERLLTGNEVKIVYDEPWFWKISAIRDMESHTQEKKPYKNERPTYSKLLHAESQTKRSTNEFSRYNRRRDYNNDNY